MWFIKILVMLLLIRYSYKIGFNHGRDRFGTDIVEYLKRLEESEHHRL